MNQNLNNAAIIAACIAACVSLLNLIGNIVFNWRFKRKEIRLSKSFDNKALEIKTFLKMYLVLQKALNETYNEAFIVDLFGNDLTDKLKKVDECLDDFDYSCSVVKIFATKSERVIIDEINNLVFKCKKSLGRFYFRVKNKGDKVASGQEISDILDEIEKILKKDLPPLYNTLEVSWHKNLSFQ